MKNTELVKKCATSIALLWFVQLFVSGIMLAPIADALPPALDAELFEPGALFFLEVVRLKRDHLMRALSLSFWAFSFGLLLINFARYRLLVVVGRSCFSGTGPQATPRSVGTYFALVFFTYALWGVLAGLSSPAARCFVRHADGALAPWIVWTTALLLVVGSLFYLLLNTWTDLARLAVLLPPAKLRGAWSLRRCGRLVWATLRSQIFGLTSFRAMRALFALMQSAIVFQLMLRSNHSTLWHSFVVLVAVQGLIILSLVIETIWWGYATRRLLSQAPLPEES